MTKLKSHFQEIKLAVIHVLLFYLSPYIVALSFTSTTFFCAFLFFKSCCDPGPLMRFLLMVYECLFGKHYLKETQYKEKRIEVIIAILFIRGKH